MDLVCSVVRVGSLMDLIRHFGSCEELDLGIGNDCREGLSHCVAIGDGMGFVHVDQRLWRGAVAAVGKKAQVDHSDLM